MGRIAKKPRSVKGQKTGKPVPRYAIRKDSLGRRYAVDKRTGKRASVSKAEKERQKLKKAAQQFRGIKPKKAPKPPKAAKPAVKKKKPTPKKPKQPRAAAPKKPRVKPAPVLTRKERVAQAIADLQSGKRTREQISDSELPTPVPIVNQLGALIPEGMRVRTLDGLADRIERFPKVAAAAENSWIRLQRDSYGHQFGEGPTMAGSQFDRDHNKPGLADYIRYEIFARARDLQDIEQLITEIVDTDDDFQERELYTLFFSPDVA